jgi:hypothetical protein
MGIDDYVNAETGLMTAATAAAVSPRARELMRRGAVYGIAGAMRAGDVVAAAARGAVRGARESIAQENGTEGGTPSMSGGAGTASTAGASGSRSGRSSGQSGSSSSRSRSAGSRTRGTPPPSP